MSLLMQSFSEGGPDSVLAIISMPVRFENTTGTLTASHCPIVVLCQYCCFGWQTPTQWQSGRFLAGLYSCDKITSKRNEKWLNDCVRVYACMFMCVHARLQSDIENETHARYSSVHSHPHHPDRHDTDLKLIKKAMCILSSLLSSSSPPHPSPPSPRRSIHVSPVARVAV